MSSITSIFIKSDMTLHQLSSNIGNDIGVHFALEQEDGRSRYVTTALGATFFLFGDHGLENDMGIAFSEYQYELDIEVMSAGIEQDLADRFHCQLTLFLLWRVAARLNVDCLAVADLQRILGDSSTVGRIGKPS